VVLTQAHIQINGRLAWEVGIEITQRTLKNGEVLNTKNFVTNVYANKNGEWLMVTHHASAVPREDLLKVSLRHRSRLRGPVNLAERKKPPEALAAQQKGRDREAVGSELRRRLGVMTNRSRRRGNGAVIRPP